MFSFSRLWTTPDVDLLEPDVADDVIDHLCCSHVAPRHAWSSQFSHHRTQHGSSSHQRIWNEILCSQAGRLSSAVS
jgi:hypothetical protein